ncbi:MAG: hypothetical protein ACI31R_04440 [Bacilli bacterium]
MKKILKVLLGIFIALYLVVATFLTVCLLSYNDYKISVIGNKSLIILDDDALEPEYKKGSLLIVEKNKNDDIKVNDEIFFYNTYENQIVVNKAKVEKTQKITDTETTFTINKKYEISSEYVIGKTDTTKVIDDLGSVLGFLESKWGFLIVIVFPLSLLFVYEIYAIIREIRYPDEKK